MPESLDEIKERIAKQFLGRAGIHAGGLRRSRGAVAVDLSAAACESAQPVERELILKELRGRAAPYEVILIEEEPPSIRPGAT